MGRDMACNGGTGAPLDGIGGVIGAVVEGIVRRGGGEIIVGWVPTAGNWGCGI